MDLPSYKREMYSVNYYVKSFIFFEKKINKRVYSYSKDQAIEKIKHLENDEITKIDSVIILEPFKYAVFMKYVHNYGKNIDSSTHIVPGFNEKEAYDRAYVLISLDIFINRIEDYKIVIV